MITENPSDMQDVDRSTLHMVADTEFAALLKICLWDCGLEAHTTKGQTLIRRPRKAKRSRLTGKLK